jgi:hypothetical protein
MQTMEEQTTNESIRRLEERMDERFDHVNVEFGRIDARFQVAEANIRELRADQKATAEALSAKIEKTAEGLSTKIEGTAEALRTEIKDTSEALRTEIKGTAGELRAEMKGTTGELRTEMGELRADIKSMQRTMLYGFFTLAGIMLSLVGFLLA